MHKHIYGHPRWYQPNPRVVNAPSVPRKGAESYQPQVVDVPLIKPRFQGVATTVTKGRDPAVRRYIMHCRADMIVKGDPLG